MANVYLDPTAGSTGTGLSSSSPVIRWVTARALFATTATAGDYIIVMDGGQPDVATITATTTASNTTPAFTLPVSGNSTSAMVGIKAYVDPATGRVHRPVWTCASSTHTNASNIIMGSPNSADQYQEFRNIIISTSCGGSMLVNGYYNLVDGCEVDRGPVTPIGSGNVSSIDSFNSTGLTIQNSYIGAPYPSTGSYGAADNLNWRAIQTDGNANLVTVKNCQLDGNDSNGSIGFGTKRFTNNVTITKNLFLNFNSAAVELSSRNDHPSTNGPTAHITVSQNVIYHSTVNCPQGSVAESRRAWGVWLDNNPPQPLDDVTIKNNTFYGNRGILTCAVRDGATSTGGVFQTFFGAYNNILYAYRSSTNVGGEINEQRWSGLGAGSTCNVPSTTGRISYNTYYNSTGATTAFSTNGGSSTITLATWQALADTPDTLGVSTGTDPVFVGPFTGEITADLFRLQASSPYWSTGTEPGKSDGTAGGTSVTRGAFMTSTDVIGVPASVPAGSGLIVLGVRQ